MKKQTGIVKDQYKFFKDWKNAINYNREDNVKVEDDVKTEDVEIIDNMHHRDISDEYKNFIAIILSLY